MLRLSKSCLTKVEKDNVLSVLDREYLGMGSEVKQFEAELSNYFDCPTACVSSGTAALHLALQALELGPGDEVLVQTLTFISPINAIRQNYLSPIFMDVDRNFNIDQDKVIKFIENNTYFKNGKTINKITTSLLGKELKLG